MDTDAPISPQVAQIIPLMSAFTDSGKSEDFYAMQDWMSSRVAEGSSLSNEIARVADKVAKAAEIKSLAAKSNRIAEPGHDRTAEMAEMFAADIEIVRSDPEFTGTQMQMDNLRNILSCGDR